MTLRWEVILSFVVGVGVMILTWQVTQLMPNPEDCTGAAAARDGLAKACEAISIDNTELRRRLGAANAALMTREEENTQLRRQLGVCEEGRKSHADPS